MKGNRTAIIAVIVIVVAIAGWWLFKRGSSAPAIDLVEQFPTAYQKRPNAEIYSVADVTLNGETKKSITVQPTPQARLIYKIHVPDNGWFSTNVGLKQEAWTQDGDGVLFMVGVNAGGQWEELTKLQVNPKANQADRRWIPIWVDLSAYAGEDIELIMNMFAGPPGSTDLRADFGVWGAPAIVVR
jgi:hypothetical protein